MPAGPISLNAHCLGKSAMADSLTLKEQLEAADADAGAALQEVAALKAANGTHSQVNKALQRSEHAQSERNRILREMGRLPPAP